MTYEKIYADVKKSLMKADVTKLKQDFAIQCNIQGEGEGSFYIALKEGVFSVEPYDYKDNDAQLYASGDTFMKMFSKKIDGKDAFEQGLLGFDGDVGVVLLLGNLQPKKKETAAKKTPAGKKKSGEA
ncbi:MAG: SCP2 sterol-binding domain-containing protein [Oscillospiraceae bacterium]|nr:SCP2 sterol-binding domain-containing protein [Oscillospiraceae bacterium]